MLYVPKVAEDRLMHRERHREVIQTYEPKPLAVIARSYAEHGTFVPLNACSPLTLRRRLENMGRMFKREEGYDFPPYEASEDGDRTGRHWMIVSQDGRAIGGLSARWREYSNAPARWQWAWVWVIPAERRSGWMHRCWTMIRNEISEIEPELPLSIPAARFFAKCDDVTDRVRKHAASVIQEAAKGAVI